MARGSIGSYAEGSILHFGAIRLRVTGSGNLQLFLRSLDNVRNVQLASVALASTTDIEPTKLANFTQQRACWEVRTTEIDEVFNISKITLFAKQVATSYPQ